MDGVTDAFALRVVDDDKKGDALIVADTLIVKDKRALNEREADEVFDTHTLGEGILDETTDSDCAAVEERDAARVKCAVGTDDTVSVD